MYLAVTCKNLKYHSQKNPFSGYRIKVSSRPAGPFKLQCDSCGKTYTYDPQDVLEMADQNIK